MSDEDAIENLKNFINDLMEDYSDYKEIFEIRNSVEYLETTIKKQYNRIKELEIALIEEDYKNRTVINEMAKYIAGLDIEEDICVKTGRLGECDSMAYGECENCIKEYFKKKVEENE